MDCGLSFRRLPPDGLPFKRYLKGEIEARCERYVATDHSTYRSTVRDEGLPVYYAGVVAEPESSEAEKEAESTPALCNTTVHRWLSWLAVSYESELWRLEERVQQFSDSVDLTPFSIPPRKYRSENRRKILEICRRVLRCLNFIRNPP